METVPFFRFVGSKAIVSIIGYRHSYVFNNYAHWIRVQVVVWYFCCLEFPAVLDFIWFDTVGPFFVLQLLYIYTRYELLFDIQDLFYKYTIGHSNSGPILRFVTDMAVQCMPVLFAYNLFLLQPPGKASFYPCVYSMMQQALYPYLMYDEWDSEAYYGQSLARYGCSKPMVFAFIFAGHTAAYLLRCTL